MNQISPEPGKRSDSKRLQSALGGQVSPGTISAAAGHTSGSAIIVGFQVGTDHLQLTGYAAAPGVTAVAGGSALFLADGTNVTLREVTTTGIATLLG